MATPIQYFETESARDAAIKRDLLADGVDATPDNVAFMQKYYQVTPATPAASGNVPITPVPTKPTVSESEQRQKERAELRGSKTSKGSSEWTRTQDPEIRASRQEAVIVSDPEARDIGFEDLYLPATDVASIGRQESALKADEEARLRDLEESGFDINPEARQRIKDDQANRSRQLTPAGAYPSDITYEAQPEVLPIEFSLTDPTARTFSDQWTDAISRQTSVGVDPYSGTSGVRFEPPTISFEGTEAEAQTKAARDALGELRTWLVSNSPEYRAAVQANDTQTMTEILYATIGGLNSPSTIKEPGVAEGTATQSERDALGTVLRQEQQGSIPDYTPAQLVYLQGYRTSLTRSLGTQGANEILGDPQWYEDPELKRQRLAAGPEFEGLMGLGVYRYPSGAVVESTPMYALRLVAAPANFTIGLATGLFEQGMDFLHPGTGAIIQRGREQSEINPAGRFVGEPMPSPISIALDNVKRNRGATEEIYDFGRAAAPDATNNNFARGLLFTVGLGIDVVAVPVLPGAGAAMELAGAYSRGSRVFNAIGNIEGASQAAFKAADAPGTALRMLPDPLIWVAKKAGLAGDAPGDIRLITARALTDLYEQSAEIAAKLPKPFVEAVSDTLKVVDDAIAGEAKAMVSKILLRNVQTVMNADPGVIARLQLSGVTSPAELVSRVLNDDIAKAAVKRSMVAEEAISWAFQHFKNEGIGSLFMITPRVAVTSADEAKSILAKVAENPIMKLAQESAKKPDAAALAKLLDWVSTRDVLSSLADGSSTIRASIETAIGTTQDTVKVLDGATVRLIADAVANDIALASKDVKALSPQALRGLDARTVNALLTPFETRPTAITNAVSKVIDYFKGEQLQPSLSPLVQSIINEVQQTVAATGSLVQRELVARVKAGAPNRAQALEDMITSIIDSSDRGSKSVAATIESMVIFNRPSSFSGSKILAPLRTTIDHLKDPAVANVIKMARATLRIDLDKAFEGSMTYKVAIETYLDRVTKGLKEAGLDTKITVVSSSSINEIMVAIVLDSKINDVLNKGVSTVLAEYKVAIPAGIIEDAAKTLKPDEARNLEQSLTSGIARLMSEGRYGGLHSFIKEYKKVAPSTDDYRRATRLYGDGDLDMGLKGPSVPDVPLQNKAAALLDGRGDNQPLLRLYYAAEDAALGALKAQGLDRLLTPLESVRLLDDVAQSFSDPSKLVPEARALVEALRETGYDQGKLWDYVRSDPGSWNLTNFLGDAWNGLKKTQYFFMLYARTRFHGVNIMTAPFIIASTIGASWSTSAMTNIINGFRISARIGDLEVAGSRALSDFVDNTAFITTAAGKSYTVDDIADLAMKGGITRTETGMGGASSLVKPLSDLLEADAVRAGKDLKSVLKNEPITATKYVNMPVEFAALWDRTWRSSVLVAALKEGRTETEAVALAREALFDYGRLTDFEQRYIANWFMYYSFTRSSIANALWNILNNPSRVANQIKATKGFPWIAGEGKPGDDDSGKGAWQRSIFYESGYMQARPWLGSNLEKAGKGSYGVYGPPLPLVDSYVFLAKIVGSALSIASMGYLETPISKDIDPGDFAMERMNPIVSNILSNRSEQMYGRGYIDPRHIAALRATGTWDTFTQVIGQPSTRKAQPGETAWLMDQAGQPLTYTFEGDSAAIGNYVRLVKASSILGTSLVINDYAPMLTDLPTVSPIETGVELQHGWNAARIAGAATWSKQDRPLEVLERNAKATEGKLKRVEK